MSRPRAKTTSSFHEFPLVLFTSLVVIGAGLPAGHFAAWALGMTPWTPNRVQALLSTFTLAAGLLVSLLHLGHPFRSAYALRRAGRSPLSTEVVLVLLIIVPSTAALVLHGHPALNLSWGLVAAASPGLLLTLGWVYRLPGQLAWRGAAELSPLLLGLAIGFLSQAASASDGGRILAVVVGLLALETVGFAMRWKVLNSENGEPVYPGRFQARKMIMTLRLMDVTLLPALFVLADYPSVALFVLAFGVLFDRFAFYALAVRQTTESEISRIERILRSKQS